MDITESAEGQNIFRIDLVGTRFEKSSKVYQNADPFPHIFLDEFLSESVARQAMASFPAVKDNGWIHYMHVNEKKHGLNKSNLIPEPIRNIILQLNNREFLMHLSKLTGIERLLPDPGLEGGGLHQTQRGGFLNIHADFTVHPHKKSWKRRVNLLIYLNQNWQPEYGGDLELWSRDMKQCKVKIAPLFNRVVIFNTEEDSYHGLPNPLNCPDDMTRKSIALYHYTEEKDVPKLVTTNYRARPGDGLKSILIYFDKKLIQFYTLIKRKFGMNDDFVSNLLNRFSRKK
jgi:Rps23 Pro-64 3,4-dihydroxylase Tpa1-like proline 4-hydroxylase